MIEATRDWVWETNGQGVYTYSSSRVKDLLGYEPSEILGKTPFDLMPPDEVERLRPIIDDTFARSAPFLFLENRNLHKDGRIVVLETSGLAIRDTTGKLLGYRGIDRDITERKNAEQERRMLEARVQQIQKFESLGVLAGGIAHDFNNLLMSVLANADLVLEELSEFSPARANIDEIIRTSQRAADLCSQMLAYSGKGRLELKPLNISDIVLEMTRMLEISVSKKVSLRNDFSSSLPFIKADPTQIRQIIINLITNASEAIERREGTILLSTRKIDCNRKYLLETLLGEDLPEGTYVSLEVSDTGSGMNEDTLKRIFEPFFTTKFTGRGLGLAAVLGIVKGHKGTLKVVTKPGHGTTFTVLFPAVAEPFDAGAIAAAEHQMQESAGTILLVDDERAVRDIGSFMLSRIGFRVLTASDGLQAIDVMQQHVSEVDCVVLDLSMPNMDGSACFHRLRELRPDVYVVFSSGFSNQEFEERFPNETSVHFIQKPYQMKTLATILRELLKKPEESSGQ